MRSPLLEQDHGYHWHPGSSITGEEQCKPLVVKRAYGSYIELLGGKKIIDATASWWCKSLGHNHPQLKDALKSQIDQFEHVIFANTTHEALMTLSQKLSSLLPGLNKVFYAGDGSSAVEIALKMSLHSHVIDGNTKKNQFIALSQAYHGETMGALGVSDLPQYRDPYRSTIVSPLIIEPLYVNDIADPQWDDASVHWEKIIPTLERYREVTAGIIVEPIIQAAAGMNMYSQDFLHRLGQFAKANNIHLIADEIMTGVGRTGKMLACEHANINPDIICLGKGLTSGWLPFSAVVASNDIYERLVDDHKNDLPFLHSHTYSGNALGACLALETLHIIQHEQLCDKATQLQTTLRSYLQAIADDTGRLTNVRGIGAVIAADLVTTSLKPNAPRQFYQQAIQLGALMRPIGQTIYWTPPLNVSDDTLCELKQITHQALQTLPCVSS